MFKIILFLSLIAFAYSASLNEKNDKVNKQTPTVNTSQLSDAAQSAVVSIVQPLMSSLIGSALQPIRQIQDSLSPALKPVIRTSLQTIFNSILAN